MPQRACPTRSLTLVAALAAIWIADPARADDVVITGTRLPVSSTGLAQNVTVIDQREIQAQHPGRLEDILARVTGAYVDQAGTTGGFVSMYMRGAENSHLLVMLDGVKLNDPTTTRGSAYDLSAIDVSQIERIEVLRGPASAVYGGEALAGVVHIITRRASEPGVHGAAYAAAGGDHYRKLGASVAFGQDGLGLQFGAGRTEDGGSGDDATLRLNTVSGAVRFARGEAFDAELFGSQVERKSLAFPDDSGGPRLAVNRERTRRESTDRSYGVRLAAGRADTLRVQASAVVADRSAHDDNAFVDGGQRFPVPSFVGDTDFKRTTYTLSATHAYGQTASVVAGLEHQTEKGSLKNVGDFFFVGSPQTLTFELDRKSDSAFVEGRITFGPVGVQVGVRHDKVEGIEGVTTPHIGLVWNLPGGATTLKANVNEGFKPPSFFALGFPIGGNPDLKPERSKNAEVTLSHRLDSAGSMLQLSVFRTRYEDLVDFDGETFTNINRGTIVVQGLEPELRLRLTPTWRLQASATVMNIDVRDGLQPLRNRPERKAAAGLTGEIGAGRTLFMGLSHSGRFLDRANPTGDIAMPGYTVFDAAYTMRYGPVTLKLAVDNLFDKDYEQFVGFPAQGRRLRAEVRAAF